MISFFDAQTMVGIPDDADQLRRDLPPLCRTSIPTLSPLQTFFEKPNHVAGTAATLSNTHNARRTYRNTPEIAERGKGGATDRESNLERFKGHLRKSYIRLHIVTMCNDARITPLNTPEIAEHYSGGVTDRGNDSRRFKRHKTEPPPIWRQFGRGRKRENIYLCKQHLHNGDGEHLLSEHEDLFRHPLTSPCPHP